MPYPEDFVVRLLISIVGMFAIWLGVQYVVDVFIHHQQFAITALDIIAPLGMGIVEAFVWKPKDQK